MRQFFSSGVLPACLVLFSAAASSATTITPVNDGFERPDLGSGVGAYGYVNQAQFLVVPGWTAVGGGAGVAANGSAFNVSNADNVNFNPFGTSTAGQAGLLQGGDGTLTGAAYTQTLAGFAAGTATISLKIEERPTGNSDETVSVFLDGVLLNTFTPASTSTFNLVTTTPVSVTAGSHTIGFAGTAGTGDTTVFIDSISVNNVAVPEPASFALFGLGAFGLFVIKRRAVRPQCCTCR